MMIMMMMMVRMMMRMMMMMMIKMMVMKILKMSLSSNFHQIASGGLQMTTVQPPMFQLLNPGRILAGSEITLGRGM